MSWACLFRDMLNCDDLSLTGPGLGWARLRLIRLGPTGKGDLAGLGCGISWAGLGCSMSWSGLGWAGLRYELGWAGLRYELC
jgi:hypothetical protein